MADDIGSIFVKITGDASEFEKTIQQVSKELDNLEKRQSKASKRTTDTNKNTAATENSTKAKKKNSEAEQSNTKAKAENTKTEKNSTKETKTSVSATESSTKAKKENTTAEKSNTKAKSESANVEKSKVKATESSVSATKKHTSAVKENETATKKQKSTFESTGKSIKSFGEGVDTVTKPLQYAAVALAAGGVASAKFAIDFEDSFAGVQKTVDGTPEQLEKVKQGIIDLSTVGINGRSAIPMTTTQLNELASTGGQLGIATDNIVDFTEVMAQMGTATNLTGSEGAQTLARFLNVTQTSQDQVRNLGSSIVYLGNNYATTEAEIASMSLRLGRTGTLVGMGAADVLGYSTALTSMGIEAEAGGSAVSKTWTKIDTAVATGGEKLEKFASLSGKSVKDFSNQWQTDASGAFNDFIKGLSESEELPQVLQDLDINEIREADALKALALGYDTVTKAANDANTAWGEGTALQKEFDTKAATTASQLQLTKQNIVEAARGIGETLLPSIKDASTGVADFAKKLSGMDDSQKKAIVNTGATVIALGAISKGAVGAIKGVGGLVEGIGKIKTAISAGGALAKLAPLLSGIASPASAAALAVAGTALAPAAIVAAYTVIADHVTEAIENNSKLGQRYRDLYDTWSEADGQVQNLSSLNEEYQNLDKLINSGNLNPEQLETAKNRINEIMQEIKSLTNDDTIKLMIDTGDFETALSLAVSQAQDAADEIREALNASNYKDAKKAVSEGYDAVDKGSLYGADYKNQQQEYKEWLNSATQYKEQYRSIMNSMNKAYEDGSSERIKAAALERETFINGLKDSDFTKAYEKFTGNQFKFGDMDEMVAQIQNVSNSYRDVSDNITSMDERAKNGRESLQAMAQVATEDAINLNGFKNIEEVFKSGGNAVELVGKQIQSTMADWGFANQDIAAQVALFKNGFDNLQGAVDNNALDAVVRDFISEAEKLNMPTNDIVEKAALMKNGFSDIQQAIASGDISGLLNDIGKLGGDMGMSVAQIDAFAHSIGLIPDDKNIVINASGDVSIIEDVQQAVEAVNANGNVNLQVSATGDVSVLDTADEKLKELVNNNQVTIKFNVETGGFDIADLQGNKIGDITANGKINWTNGEVEKPKDEKAEGTIDYALGKVDKPENAVAEGTINYTLGSVATPTGKPNAKGTQNFEGGLAMVNDEKGISDPRELIVDKGQAFIPHGKDVVLPLSKGARVYTASQTKAIMSGMGIPRYAGGKNNSDGFTAAKDDWSHYTKTHAVTTTQELEKWVELSEQFKDNEKDVWDIQEQIFSLLQKQTKERNDQSKAYLEERAALNDWESVGDSPLEAFERIRENNFKDLQESRQTWDDYVNNVSDAGESLYDNMKDYSDSWLEQQRKYNKMSADDYIAGLDREMARLEEFYAQGLIETQKYVEEKQAIENEKTDAINEKNADEYTAWKKDADAWQEMRNTYGDWDKYGDSEEDFLKRRIQRVKEKFDAGRISFEEYIDDTNQYSMDLYKSQERSVDDLLSKQQEYISKMREQFSEQERALQDRWTVEDRKVDMSDVQGQLDIYANAVTDQGQQKYKELQEQMKQLQRDEELYNLQVKNNTVIESLESEYQRMEDGKLNILQGLQLADINISGYVEAISKGVENVGNTTNSLLSQLLEKFDKFKVENTSMVDSRKIVNNISQLTPEQLQELMDNTVGR